jgi:hypothetical protein
MSISFYGPTDRTRVACDDCNWKGQACELEAISDFSERVSPGEICPAGECPQCGALAHVVGTRRAPGFTASTRKARAEA